MVRRGYTTDGRPNGKGGVDLTVPQVQAMRYFIGLNSAWIRKFAWTKEEFEEKLAPFFNDLPQDQYQNLASYQSGFDPDLISKREDILEAIRVCIRYTSVCCLTGQIMFDSKEIAKLKVHPGINCKEFLYATLKAMANNIDSLKTFDEDHKKDLKKTTDTFFDEWREDLYNTIKINWNILKTYETEKKILEKVTQLITPLDPRLLGGKVNQLKGGEFKFKNIEDQRTEYKQSMFSPRKIKQMEETDPKIHSRLVEGQKNSLINEVLSSVCAFLNTNNGDIYIGVADKPRKIIGLSDDRNSGVFKKELSYPEFQEKYKKKILQLMKKRIKNFDPSYVDGIGYPDNYGEDDNGDDIDVLHIPCTKIPESGPPVFLKNSLNEDGHKIKEEEILFKRDDESDYVVLEKDRMRHYQKYFRTWRKRVFPDE